MQCTRCEAPLTGGVDTYGRLDQPMCQSCHLEVLRGPLPEPMVFIAWPVVERITGIWRQP